MHLAGDTARNHSDHEVQHLESEHYPRNSLQTLGIQYYEWVAGTHGIDYRGQSSQRYLGERHSDDAESHNPAHAGNERLTVHGMLGTVLLKQCPRHEVAGENADDQHSENEQAEQRIEDQKHA